jgi:hypothetical protein
MWVEYQKLYVYTASNIEISKADALHRIHPTPISVWVPCESFDGGLA